MSENHTKKIILVTGVPRSGTTIIGRTLDLCPDVFYVWEPFNKYYRAGIKDYYPYIGKSTAAEKQRYYVNLFDETFAMRNMRANIIANENDNIAIRLGKKCGINRTALRYLVGRIKFKTRSYENILVKCPISAYLAESLICNRSATVVVTIRHPCAIANARKELNWRFDYNVWLSQEDLVKDHLRDLINKHPYYALDVIHESAFHWMAIYSYLLEVRDKYPDKVILVRHEDFISDPEKVMETIAKHCNIHMPKNYLPKIVSRMPVSARGRRGSDLAVIQKRNPYEMQYRWQKILTTKEIDSVLRITKPIAEQFDYIE